MVSKKKFFACACLATALNMQASDQPALFKIDPQLVDIIIQKINNGVEEYTASLGDHAIITTKRNADGTTNCFIARPLMADAECDSTNFELLQKIYAQKMQKIEEEAEITAAQIHHVQKEFSAVSKALD